MLIKSNIQFINVGKCDLMNLYIIMTNGLYWLAHSNFLKIIQSHKHAPQATLSVIQDSRCIIMHLIPMTATPSQWKSFALKVKMKFETDRWLENKALTVWTVEPVEF